MPDMLGIVPKRELDSVVPHTASGIQDKDSNISGLNR